MNTLWMLIALALSGDDALHYLSVHGGAPAGQWDKSNFEAFARQSAEGGTPLSVKLTSIDLYQAPVPTKLTSVLNGQAPPDLVTSFVGGDLRHFIQQDKLMDLSSLWNEVNGDQIFGTRLKRLVTHEGKQYFLPQAIQWNPIFYRRDLFESLELSVPESFDELLELCEIIGNNNRTPFACSVNQWNPPVARWFTILNLRINGPEYHEDLMAGRESWDDDPVREVFLYWLDLFDAGAFHEDSAKHNYSQAMTEFVSGRALMYNLGEWIFEVPAARQLGEKVDFFLFPVIDEDITPAEIVHVYGAWAMADTAAADTAADALKYLAGSVSQASNSTSLTRLVSHGEVTPPGALYEKGRKLISQTPVLVPLLEFNTRPGVAQAAQTAFSKFWRDHDYEAAMASIEIARQRAYRDAR